MRFVSAILPPNSTETIRPVLKMVPVVDVSNKDISAHPRTKTLICVQARAGETPERERINPSSTIGNHQME
jgi:hypothetical protein